MKRRTFLRHTVHGAAVASMANSMGWAATGKSPLQSLLKIADETDKVLVLVYLDGGNDGLNTVVPLDQLSTLNSFRPHVVLPESSLLTLNGTNVGLHPALSGFRSLFNEDRLGIVQSVGYPEPNYSHFRSTDIWMSASDSSQYLNTGWMGRYLANANPGYPEGYPNTNSPHPLAIESGYGASLLFQGPAASMGMVLSGPESFYELVDNVEQDAPDTPAGDKLRYVRLIQRQSQQYGEVVQEAAQKINSQGNYPETGLAQQLKIVARLIAGGLKTPIYMVRLGGFDTHDAQVVPGNHLLGEHTQLLTELNDAIMAFMNDLEGLNIADRVVGMTFSEFGRTIMSNASDGTDHGTAAPLFVFGNSVSGGLKGSNPDLPDAITYETDLEMQYDFRQVYASMLNQWFDVPTAEVDGVMGKPFEQITLIGGKTTGLFGPPETPQTLKVYPNPLNGQASIQFEATGEATIVELIDLNGRTVERIYQGKPAVGRQTLHWGTGHLRRGQYMVLMRTATQTQHFRVVK